MGRPAETTGLSTAERGSCCLAPAQKPGQAKARLTRIVLAATGGLENEALPRWARPLSVAHDIATGEVIGRCQPKNYSREFETS